MAVSPFLKWAGGKRWLINAHPNLINFKFNRYIEPFLGSGAMYFHLMPEQAILSDKNKLLIDTYRCIKEDWQKVVTLLELHAKNHSMAYYYQLRSTIFNDNFERSAQFLYLNRTCWNGLYRVNKSGIFNVPKGTKDNVLLPNDDFMSTSLLLEKAILLDGDFELSIDLALDGDLLFVDPPYTANHNNNGFLKYNESIFSWDDQIRLRNSLLRAKNRGVRIIVTNADHESIKELYQGHFSLTSATRASVLSSKPKYRCKVTELIITG